jgi:pimeloyl-ACP methyl ester carboxylesterase
MPAKLKQQWLETALPGRGAIRYLTAGAGEPVIFLHGLSGSVDWWRRNLSEFAAAFTVYAIDLIHHGNVASGRFSLGEAAGRLAAWMKATGIRRAHMIGHSMGGQIAAKLAAGHPALIRKLVLVNAALLFPETSTKFEPARLLRWLPTFPPTLAPLLLRDALRAGPAQLWGASRDLLASDLRGNFPRISTPTLIVWGDRDGLLPVELAHELHEQLPGSRLHIVEGTGHNVMWEAPDEFNRVVLDFLHEPDSPSR